MNMSSSRVSSAGFGGIENVSKACPPATHQAVLGVLIDTVALTISVTPERMGEI